MKKALSQDAIEGHLEIKINRTTIYRVLNRFCEHGLVYKIVAEDGKQYSAICKPCERPENIQYHFHFRCLSCDSIKCMQIPVNYSVPEGYEVQNANCVLTGTCKYCS